MTMLSFVWALVLSGSVIGLIFFVFAGLAPRLRHWPLFWAIGLMASVLTAFLAFGLSRAGILTPSQPILPWTISEPFSPGHLEVFAAADEGIQGAINWLGIIGNAIIGLYVLGVIFNLFKLGLGRLRAARLARRARDFQLKNRSRIGLTSEAITCMTMTPIGRPMKSRIILSEEFFGQLSDPELQAVIRHEQAHIIRRDDEIGLLLRACLALSWFNPVSHILFRQWMASAELQCDQIAMTGQSRQMRRAYAATLLKALHIKADQVRQYPVATLSPQHLRNEKMRIDRIMSGSGPIFKHFGHGAVLVVAALGLSLTSAVALSAPADAKPAPSPAILVIKDNNFKITGKLTSAFGPALDPFNKGATRNHLGVDFGAPLGTPIYAPANGVIIEAAEVFERSPSYGTVVIFQTAGGVQTMLAHLDSFDVKPGQQISKGQKIAEIGSSGKSTGPHVHIETRRQGKLVDPMSVWDFDLN